MGQWLPLSALRSQNEENNLKRGGSNLCRKVVKTNQFGKVKLKQCKKEGNVDTRFALQCLPHTTFHIDTQQRKYQMCFSYEVKSLLNKKIEVMKNLSTSTQKGHTIIASCMIWLHLLSPCQLWKSFGLSLPKGWIFFFPQESSNPYILG